MVGLQQTSLQSVTIRSRTAVWDSVKNDYVYGSWKEYQFVYEKPQDIPVVIETLELAYPNESNGNTTTDPTILGTISNDGEVGNLLVEVFKGSTPLGTTTTDASGQFYFTASTLSVGTHALTVKVREWNNVTRQYQYGTSSTITLTLQRATIMAPTISGIQLGDDTGISGDNKTANPYLIGQLNEDGGSLSRVMIEFSHAGNGTVNGTVFTESDGTFRYSPTLSAGTYNLKARAARWDTSTSQWVRGEWFSNSFVVQTAGANWKPVVAELTTAFGETNSHGIMVTDDPAVKGQLSSEGGFDNLVVQYDLNGDGTVEYEGDVDSWGRFAWRPTLELSAGQTQNVTMKVRAGKVVDNVTTWGDWSTLHYIYQIEAIVDSHLDYWTIDQANDDSNTHKITGDVRLGNNSVMTSVEIDYRGDGAADGYAVPNANGEFVFDLTPEKSQIRLRVVETLADGTKYYPTEGWRTLSIVVPTSDAPNPVLQLAKGSERESGDVLLKVVGVNNYNDYFVKIDLNGDGNADCQVTPDSQGRITGSMIEAALRQDNGTDGIRSTDDVFRIKGLWPIMR